VQLSCQNGPWPNDGASSTQQGVRALAADETGLGDVLHSGTRTLPSWSAVTSDVDAGGAR
jgi:phosphate-selective porin